MFLVTKLLDRSQSRKSQDEKDETQQYLPGAQISVDIFRQNQRKLITNLFNHWGIFVSHEADLLSGKLFELTKRGGISSASMRDGKVITQTENGTLIWNLQLLGYTTLSDKSIHDIGN